MKSVRRRRDWAALGEKGGEEVGEGLLEERCWWESRRRDDRRSEWRRLHPDTMPTIVRA